MYAQQEETHPPLVKTQIRGPFPWNCTIPRQHAEFYPPNLTREDTSCICKNPNNNKKSGINPHDKK